MKPHATTQEISALVLLLFGMAFALIALLIPPAGQIHASVCWVFAQCLVYAGSVFGISCYIERLKAHLSAPQPTAPVTQRPAPGNP